MNLREENEQQYLPASTYRTTRASTNKAKIHGSSYFSVEKRDSSVQRQVKFLKPRAQIQTKFVLSKYALASDTKKLSFSQDFIDMLLNYFQFGNVLKYPLPDKSIPTFKFRLDKANNYICMAFSYLFLEYISLNSLVLKLICPQKQRFVTHNKTIRN